MIQRRDYGELVLDTLLEKGVINNELYEKCSSNGGNKRLNYKIKQTFHEFYEKTCGKKHLKHEKGVITDKNGNVLWETNKNQERKSSILLDIPKFQELRMKYGELNLDHNHPLLSSIDEKPYHPNTLSRVDLGNMDYRVYDESLPDGMGFIFKSMTAESPSGNRMTVLRKENYDGRKDGENYEKVCDKLIDFYMETEDKFLNEMYKDVNHNIYLFEQKNGREATTDEVTKIEYDIGYQYYQNWIDGLKPIQKEFNECNMELIVEMVR